MAVVEMDRESEREKRPEDNCVCVREKRPEDDCVCVYNEGIVRNSFGRALG